MAYEKKDFELWFCTDCAEYTNTGELADDIEVEHQDRIVEGLDRLGDGIVDYYDEERIRGVRWSRLPCDCCGQNDGMRKRLRFTRVTLND